MVSNTLLNLARAEGLPTKEIKSQCSVCLTTTPRKWKEEDGTELNYIVLDQSGSCVFEGVDAEGNVDEGFYLANIELETVELPNGYSLLCIDCFENMCDEPYEEHE